MEMFWQDLRYGLPKLLKAPSVSIVATIALALGIGAHIAIFSVVNAVLLRPLPFANSESLSDRILARTVNCNRGTQLDRRHSLRFAASSAL